MSFEQLELQAAVVAAVNDAWANKESVLPAIKESIKSVFDGGMDDRLAGIDNAIKIKQAELLEAGRDEERIEHIGDEIIRLRDEKQDVMTEAAMRYDLQDRLDDLAAFFGRADRGGHGIQRSPRQEAD